MTKKSTLARQIHSAQKSMESLPSWMKQTARFEGSDPGPSKTDRSIDNSNERKIKVS